MGRLTLAMDGTVDPARLLAGVRLVHPFPSLLDGAVVALTADDAETPRLPSEWLAPVDAFFASLVRKAADESIPDAVLLDAIELASAGMPGLIEAMDVEALAETLEAGLGQAVLRTLVIPRSTRLPARAKAGLGRPQRARFSTGPGVSARDRPMIGASASG
jgi:hypothetical protein